MPVSFKNKSLNAVSFNWSFGDGTGSTETDPEHLFKKTGTFTVCLEAKSKDGCLDTICKKVDAEIHPAVDVPTGFSPNGDGHNDVLYVRGAAIETLYFKVFNRWGELVFETKDLKVGWDGTFKGKLQEMEAYAWVLDVIFYDETTAHKTGNVTLLR
jgi:gliding motility-associated-like protein